MSSKLQDSLANMKNTTQNPMISQTTLSTFQDSNALVTTYKEKTGVDNDSQKDHIRIFTK